MFLLLMAGLLGNQRTPPPKAPPMLPAVPVVGSQAAQPAAPVRLTAPASPSMQPAAVGDWTLEHYGTSCVVSRSVAAGPAAVSVSISLPISSPGADFYLVLDQPPPLASLGDRATLILAPSGRIITRDYAPGYLLARSIPASLVKLRASDIDAVASAVSVTLKAGSNPPVSVAPVGMKQAIAGATACRDMMIHALGYARNELSRIVTPAESVGAPEDWITQDDYPADALRVSEQGTTAMTWKVGVDGRASNCVVVGSSGSTSLDQAACAAILQRARYTPAKDRKGRPVVSYQSRRVVWMLPR